MLVVLTLYQFEKKRQHIEYMREQKKRFEADMKLLDLQQEKEKQEMDQIARDLAQVGITGPVSEPTTPPEYGDTGFPSAFSRPTRFSTSSVTSSPGIFNIFAPSQVASPPNQSKLPMASTPKQGSAPQSVLGSRRNSEEEELIPGALPTYRPGISYVIYWLSLKFPGIRVLPPCLFPFFFVFGGGIGRIVTGLPFCLYFFLVFFPGFLPFTSNEKFCVAVTVTALLLEKRGRSAELSAFLHFKLVSILRACFRAFIQKWHVLTIFQIPPLLYAS